MNALTRIYPITKPVTAYCPCCVDGRIVTSLFGGDDPRPEVRLCNDCGGTGVVTGDLATVVLILEKAFELQNMLVAARDMGISTAVTRDLQNAVDTLDGVIDGDIKEGALFHLVTEEIP